MPVGYVYLTENLKTGMKYVGHHAGKFTKCYLGSSEYLKADIKKYGRDNFVVSALQFYDSFEELYSGENKWIEKLDAVNSSSYYNRVNTNTGRVKDKDDVDKHLVGVNNPFYGKHHSKETVEYLRKINSGVNGFNYGKRLSIETRKLMSENHADFSGMNNPNYGNHKVAGKNHPKCRKIVQLDLSGNFVQEFSYIKEAELFGFHQGNIRLCCQGKTKQYKGYKWMYKEDWKDS